MMKNLVYARGNPYILMVWLGILGSSLIFLFLLFAYLNRLRQPDWIEFTLPSEFIYSTFVMLLSSFSLWFATRSIGQEKFQDGFRWFLITLILGITFAVLQVAGWIQLQHKGILLVQIFGAFLYLLSGLHLIHILFGLSGLVIVLFHTYQNRRYVDGFIQSLNPKTATRFQMITIFWHFLDGLWLVLFAILWTGTS